MKRSLCLTEHDVYTIGRASNPVRCPKDIDAWKPFMDNTDETCFAGQASHHIAALLEERGFDPKKPILVTYWGGEGDRIYEQDESWSDTTFAPGRAPGEPAGRPRAPDRMQEVRSGDHPRPRGEDEGDHDGCGAGGDRILRGMHLDGGPGGAPSAPYSPPGRQG